MRKPLWLRRGRLRKAYHEKRGHKVLTSVMRLSRPYTVYGGIGEGTEYEFYFAPCFLCLDCQIKWQR